MSATISSRLMPGLRQQVDVRHADERDPVPAVGAHRATAPAADPRRRLAAREVADEDALLDERHGLRLDALVVPAERAHAAGRGRVGDDVDEVGAVAEARLELVRGQEARAGVGRLGAEHAVELGRVAARLVDLQVELRRGEDDREAAGRALRRRQEFDGLLGERFGLLGEAETADELVARRVPAAARIRVGAALVLIAIDRVRFDRRADVGDDLLGEAAIGGGDRSSTRAGPRTSIR